MSWYNPTTWFTREKDLSQADLERILGTSKAGKDPFEPMPLSKQLASFHESSIVYACVTALMRGFQEAPIHVESKNASGEWEEVDDHVLLDPFTKNPDLSESDIKQYICAHLELTGYSFLWKWTSRDGVVRELWPLIPSWVKPIFVEKISPNPEAKRLVAGFHVSPNGSEQQAFDIPAKDVVMMRFVDPSHLAKGMSPLVAASHRLQIDYGAEAYTAEAIQNLALPGIVVKTLKPLNTTQKSDLRSVLRQKIGKDARQNAIMVSGADVDVDVINPMKDYDWAGLNDLDETRICSAFGVPPVVIGLWSGLKNSPWSNIREAKQWMYRNTISAIWELVETGLTRALVPQEMKGSIRFAFDMSDVQELQDDTDALATRARGLWKDGVITRGEAREMIGYDTSEADNVYLTSMGTVLEPADEMPLMPGSDDLELTPEEQDAGTMMDDESNA